MCRQRNPNGDLRQRQAVVEEQQQPTTYCAVLWKSAQDFPCEKMCAGKAVAFWECAGFFRAHRATAGFLLPRHEKQLTLRIEGNVPALAGELARICRMLCLRRFHSLRPKPQPAGIVFAIALNPFLPLAVRVCERVLPAMIQT